MDMQRGVGGQFGQGELKTKMAVIVIRDYSVTSEGHPLEY